MKIINLLQSTTQNLALKKNTWLIFILAILANILIWYIWINKSQFSKTFLYYSTIVLLGNLLMVFLFNKKDILVEYLFAISAILVQIFTLVLLYHTIY
ncbi:MAG: hypothetical protein ACD_58C00035G0002 [uncultured bacterium]|nr:MAG: hypothetical protein ACD_58C00035G0002 [uncultured bacterium]